MYIYHPMNLDLQAKTAKSHSRLIVLENVKIKFFLEIGMYLQRLF